MDEDIIANGGFAIEQIQPNLASNAPRFAEAAKAINADNAHRNGDTHVEDPSMVSDGHN
jgi:hypothetical protein